MVITDTMSHRLSAISYNHNFVNNYIKHYLNNIINNLAIYHGLMYDYIGSHTGYSPLLTVLKYVNFGDLFSKCNDIHIKQKFQVIFHKIFENELK